MAGFFAKLGKGLLIGGGTILSLFAPAIGAPLVVAGTQINTGSAGTTNDKLSQYGTNLAVANNIATAMAGAGNVAGSDIVTRITRNPLPWIAGALVALFALKKFKIL
jgi:hypothetical protein